MILSRVVTGEHCVGASGIKCAPYKEGLQFEQYDSVVDDANKPSMYVVFHDASAYPEYVIKYKWVTTVKTGWVQGLMRLFTSND